MKCSSDRTTGTVVGNTNKTACLCKRKTHYEKGEAKCAECPIGGDCSIDGSAITDITALPGYWRASMGTIIFTDCAKSFSSSLTPEEDAKKRCPGGNLTNTSNEKIHISETRRRTVDTTFDVNNFDVNKQCLNMEHEAYGGPACQACLNEKYTMGSDGRCVRCVEGSTMSGTLGAVCGCMCILFFLFAAMFLRTRKHNDEDNDDNDEDNEDDGEQKKTTKKKRGCCGGVRKDQKKKKTKKTKTKEEKIEDQKGTNAASRLLGDQVLLSRVQGGSSDIGEGSAYRSDTQVVMDRIKIFYGWLQIFTSLTFTFDIKWPMQLRSFSVNLGFINFDFGSILSDTACQFALPYLEKMVVHAVIPLLLLCTILLASIPAYYFRRQHRMAQKAMLIKLISSFSLILYPGKSSNTCS